MGLKFAEGSTAQRSGHAAGFARPGGMYVCRAVWILQSTDVEAYQPCGQLHDPVHMYAVEVQCYRGPALSKAAARRIGPRPRDILSNVMFHTEKAADESLYS